MPVYGFQCNQCRTEFEVRATFQEKMNGITVICPNCKSSDVLQLLSTGMFLRTSGSNNLSISNNCCGPNISTGCCGK